MDRRFATIVLAVASLLPATGAGAAVEPSPGALVITGTRTEGDVPSAMTKLLDLRSGFSRTAFAMGDSEAEEGFDGTAWVAANGITNPVDLPALVADARSRAWLDRAGWRQTGAPGTRRRVVPSGGSPVVLWFGASGRVDHAVIDNDDGPLTVTFGDWRKVGGIDYPFRQDATDASGERTIVQAERIDPRAHLRRYDLDRPAWVSHAELTGGGPATVPVTLLGSNKSHILAPATINGAPSQLIFDTGAANYLTADAAPKFAVRTTGGINLGGVGESSTTGGYSTIDRIALGAATLRHETIVVGPSLFPRVNGKPSDTDGLTGFEFLAEFITTINYPGSSLSFAPRRGAIHPAGVRVRFYSDGHSIYVPATVDGRTAMFRLDTGAGDVTIFADYARRFGLASSAPLTNGGGGLGGTVKEQPGTLGSFAIGGLRFAQLPVNFTQNKTGAFASRSLAGNLGSVVLQCYRLTFDYAGRSVWFDPRPTLPTCGRGAKITSATD